MTINAAEYKSTVGLDSLYYALVTADELTGITFGTPAYLAPAADLSLSNNANSETQYADDGAFDIAMGEGSSDFTINITNLPPEVEAAITGQKFDSTTGRIWDDGDPASAPDAAAIAAMSPDELDGCFHTSPLWRRALTVAAGPMANFILAILVFAVLAMFSGRLSEAPVVGGVQIPAKAGPDFEVGDRILTVDGREVTTFNDVREAGRQAVGETVTVELERSGQRMTMDTAHLSPVYVAAVQDDTAAEAAGIQVGDMILSADGEKMYRFADLQAFVKTMEQDTVTLEVLRGDEVLTIDLTPQLEVTRDPDSDGFIERRLFGVNSFARIHAEIVPVGPAEALGIGVDRTVGVMVSTYHVLKSMFSGQVSAKHVSGPVGIAAASGKAAESGVMQFFSFLAFVSVSIGLVNLFPIPVLDGGHLVFYAVEAVRGKPLGARWVEISMGLGLGLVLLIMVFATYNDLGRLLSLG
jgi:regulator of sigma E protease